MIPTITSAPSGTAAPAPANRAAPPGAGTGAFGRLVAGETPPRRHAAEPAAPDSATEAAAPGEGDAPAGDIATAEGETAKSAPAEGTNTFPASPGSAESAESAEDIDALLETVRDIEARGAAEAEPAPPTHGTEADPDPDPKVGAEAQASVPGRASEPAPSAASDAKAALPTLSETPEEEAGKTGDAPRAAAPPDPAVATIATAETAARAGAEAAPRSGPFDGSAGPGRPDRTLGEAAVTRPSAAPAGDPPRRERVAPETEAPRAELRGAAPAPADSTRPEPRPGATPPPPGLSAAPETLPGAAPQAPAETARSDLAPGPAAAEAAPRSAAAPPAPIPAVPAPPVRQVMDAIVTAQADRFEIALSPEELGRVRITISHAEHGLTVHLAAEREDTMGLLRRHAAELTRALAEMGLGSADIAFGDGKEPGGESDGRGRGRAIAGLTGPEIDATLPPDTPRLTLPGRMDLRL